MPRPRKITIPISELRCFEILKSELKTITELIDFDIEGGKLTFRETYIFKVRSQNIKNALERLRAYAETVISQEIFSRQDLADLLGISRPTLNKWIKEGVVKTKAISKYAPGRPTFLFDARTARILMYEMDNYLRFIVRGERTDEQTI